MIKERNKNIDVIKFLALVSIICAHVTPIISKSVIDIKISLLFDSIGALGVSIFFLISGYLFYNNKLDMRKFFSKKMITIIIPWIFVGSLVFIMVYYFNNNLSLTNYLTFIVGYGSYLYFLTVLIVLYLIYFKLKNNNLFLIITTILSLGSIIVTIIIGYDKLSYINIFNWMIYFNIGIYLNKMKFYDKFLELCKKTKYIFLIIIIVIIALHIVKNISVGYWSSFGIIVILMNIIVVFGFANEFNFQNNKIINYIGKNSMPFYLIHMPIAGIVVRVTNSNTLLLILRPIVVLVLTLLVIALYDIIIKKIHMNKLKVLIGVR